MSETRFTPRFSLRSIEASAAANPMSSRRLATTDKVQRVPEYQSSLGAIRSAMADSASIGFGFRLLHLSLFTFLYVSAAVLIAMQPAQVLDTFFVREAAAQLRTDPLCACVLRLLGGFSAFAGVQAYLLRDRVLADQEVARPFYGAMLILVLSTLAVARRAVADGVAAPGLSASAAASAAVFGGGALLALVFPPTAPVVIDDSDDEAAPPPARIGAGPVVEGVDDVVESKKSR